MAADTSTFDGDNRKKFQNLSSKFTSLVHGRSEGDRQQINKLLDELNSLDFKTSVVTNTDKAVLLINQCCSIVLPNETFLVAKGCQLISNFVNKQHVKVEGKTLSLAISWCTQSLKYSGDIAILDILQALEALLRGNGIYVEEQIHELLGPSGALTSLLDWGLASNARGEKVLLASPWEVQLMTIRCVESLTFTTESKGENSQGDRLKIPHLESCTQVFLKHLYAEKNPEQDEIIYCKVLISSLRGLKNVLQQCPEIHGQLLGEALGTVKTYMLYGLHGYTGLCPQKMFPANLYQSDITPPASRDVRGGKSLRIRKRRQKKAEEASGSKAIDDIGHDRANQFPAQSFCSYTTPESANSFLTVESSTTSLYPAWLKTSDSDFSDTEAGQAAKTRNIQGRVRQSALTLLLVIVKVCERKVLFGYWSCLLPDAPSMQQVPTLCTCLLKDPSPRSRMLVVQVVMFMLLGSRRYLSQAENSSKTSMSFTPFSVTVGNTLKELHNSLFMALTIENSVAVITLLLKCLAALIQNTPYHRLEQGLITKLVSNVRRYLRHKDVTVQVLCLTVFGSIVAIDPGTPEITEIVTKCSVFNLTKQNDVAPPSNTEYKDNRDTEEDSNQDSDCEEVIEDDGDCLLEFQSGEGSDNMPWLLEVCLRKLGKLNMQGMARADDAISRSVPVRVESLQVLTVLAKKYFREVMSKHLATVMLVLVQTLSDSAPAVCFHSGRVIDALGNSMNLCLQEQGDNKAVSLDKSVQFWQTVLSGPLIALIQNAEETMLRAVGCDCLATIGTQVFEQLPRDRQILIITLLFGCTYDEESNVCASAIRALAVCVLFPSLREDIQFIMDTAECTIRTVQDQSLLVRAKASWSLGNLSDALVINSKSEDIEQIPSELLLKLMETSIKASQDNDKVRSNAVRAVGNFIRLITEDLMNTSKFKECTERGIAVLVRNASTGSDMKVRWNACYAIGNMMRNSALYSDNFSWQKTVFTALSKLVQDVRNFKVRISAALALSVPACRQYYGTYYISLWTALLSGLDNSQNMEDFSEYKHQDNLLDQMCLTLSHLASVATREDLVPLHDILTFHLETLQQHILKFHERVVPEKASALTSVASHAASLLQLPGLSSNQHSAAALLTSIFLQDQDTTI